jgi:hypothetical protein
MELEPAVVSLVVSLIKLVTQQLPQATTQLILVEGVCYSSHLSCQELTKYFQP